MSEENVEVVQEALAAWARTRGADVSHFAPDFELVNAPRSPFQNASGVQGLRDWIGEIDDAFEEWEFRPHEVRDAPGNKVLVFNRAWGRGRITGLELEMDLHLVYTLAEGQITRIEGYYTREEALEAAGLEE
jgi:ketosteroid isomerase-like protein